MPKGLEKILLWQNQKDTDGKEISLSQNPDRFAALESSLFILITYCLRLHWLDQIFLPRL